MFGSCFSLNELNISNFDTNNIRNMSNMFYKCSDEFKMKIRSQNPNLKNEAFN